MDSLTGRMRKSHLKICCEKRIKGCTKTNADIMIKYQEESIRKEL